MYNAHGGRHLKPETTNKTKTPTGQSARYTDKQPVKTTARYPEENPVRRTARYPEAQPTARRAGQTAQRRGKSRGRKPRRGVVIAVAAAAVIAVIAIICLIVFNNMYSLMNTSQPEAKQVTESEALAILAEDMTDGEDTVSDDEAQSIKDDLFATIQANAQSVVNTDGVYSVLLLGNDSRNDKTNERTDSMILVSINTNTKKIILTSFLRDLYVYIPGWGGSTRLNAANVFGGPEMTIDTIEQNFGVSIDNYASISFEGFKSVIDGLGGVDIELTSSEVGVINAEGYLGGSSGVYHLDGAHALAYARIRKLDSDFNRTNRQRTVLSAAWDKAKELSLNELYQLMRVLLAEVTTDLSRSECMDLVLMVKDIKDYELVSLRVPDSSTYRDAVISGMMVLVADTQANTEIVREAIYGSGE